MIYINYWINFCLIIVESAPAPTAQRQVSFNVAHDEQKEESTAAVHQSSNGHGNGQGGFGSFPGFPPIDLTLISESFNKIPQESLQNIQTFIPGGGNSGGFSFPMIPGLPFPGASQGGQNGNGHGDNNANAASAASAANSQSQGSSRTLPVFEIRSESTDNYQQEVGSSRSGVSSSGSSGYPRENPQPTLQYLSPVQQAASTSASEAVIVDSPAQQPQQQQQPQQESTQLVDSNGGYVY